MKKITLLTLTLATIASTYAEGYQVNTLSAKQLGMAHVGVSQKLNSESVWFNPAAASHQEQAFSISGGVTGIAPVAKWKSEDGSQTHTSDNKISTPIYFNANYKVTEDMSVGVTFNTPFGSSMNWGDKWAGNTQVQSISLQAYNAQPTVSYKFLNDKLSVGAGLMISWGKFELSKSFFTPEQMAMGLGGSSTLSGDADLAFGVNAGAYYEISDKWSVGASYRSKMMMNVSEGKTVCEFANDLSKQAVILASGGVDVPAILENTPFKAALPMPSTLSVGVSYAPSSDWLISAELQRVGWSTYETLNFDYEVMETPMKKDYNNSMSYRIGAQYEALSWLTARVGLYLDESPVQTQYFTPETPSMDKLSYSCGVSIAPCSHFSIDIAYAYVAPTEEYRKSTFEAFKGSYSATANIVSVGINLGF